MLQKVIFQLIPFVLEERRLQDGIYLLAFLLVKSFQMKWKYVSDFFFELENFSWKEFIETTFREKYVKRVRTWNSLIKKEIS